MPKKAKKLRGRPATGKEPMRSLRVSDAEWELIGKAADATGIGRSEFIRDAAAQKAKRVLREPRDPG